MKDVGVKGIHIAERDTQISKRSKPANMFVNTWPAELGWGTNDKHFPVTGKRHESGCQAAVYLQQNILVT
ncbi:MAG: hypothetical protein ACK5RO_09880 [Pseudobdellovibrionaceae bacterium]|jgi:homospermidine synthase